MTTQSIRKAQASKATIGSHQYKQDQRDKDLAALEKMKALEAEHLAQTEHIQLCPRSRA